MNARDLQIPLMAMALLAGSTGLALAQGGSAGGAGGGLGATTALTAAERTRATASVIS